ncbi:MAG TPA: hypothetical protein VG796_05065 [Verrucomicrobiales bacterium]|nr:hypothetical protein [Verrucomicrobiales bacterium]
MHSLNRLIIACLLVLPLPLSGRSYQIDGKVSEEVLRSYLSRSITMMQMLAGHGDFEDNVRMLKNCGVKFVGRAVYNWGREEGGEAALPARLEAAKTQAAKVHAADPEVILQACVFEIVSSGVDKLPVPAWAFEALGQPVETRNFRFADMGYASGRGQNQWGRDSCVPDVSRPETRLFFHYLAASYIDSGCEAIHFGQAELMNGNDPDLRYWEEILTRTRAYAAKHARRRVVLCDAHVPRGGLVREGRLLLDFHSFPLRIAEVPDKPQEGVLKIGYSDGIYGRSKGGLAPSGWKCDHLPFLVEFDNYGRSRKPGEAGMGGHWVWGWDEITWFSQQPESYRNDWLRYAWKWLSENDANGYLQMPGYRCLSGTKNGKRWYYANQPGKSIPDGFGQEETIRAIWTADTRTLTGGAP